MKRLSIYLFAIITVIASCSSCKKNSDTTLSRNITFYDKPLSVIQQYIKGKWSLIYYSGGYTGETHYLINYYVNFSNNRISQTYNNTVIVDTTIFWQKINVGTNDSTYALNYYTNQLFPNAYIFDEIKSDTLIYHDYESDPFYYHLIKL